MIPIVYVPVLCLSILNCCIQLHLLLTTVLALTVILLDLKTKKNENRLSSNLNTHAYRSIAQQPTYSDHVVHIDIVAMFSPFPMRVALWTNELEVIRMLDEIDYYN